MQLREGGRAGGKESRREGGRIAKREGKRKGEDTLKAWPLVTYFLQQGSAS